MNDFAGFYFIYSNGINQNNAEWFSIKQKREDNIILINNNFNNEKETKDYEIERNLLLKTTPGIPSIIGPEILKVIGNDDSNKIIYRLTTPPNHGRLFLRDAHEKLERFTQEDINSNKLIYQSPISLGIWKLMDEFGFKIYSSKNTFNNEIEPQEFKFYIENAYSNINSNDINKLIEQKPINISRGGSIAININYLNLTKLAEYTEDNILIKLEKPPNNGWIQRLDIIEKNIIIEEEEEEELKEKADLINNNKYYKWNKSINMEQLHSGQYLIYKHLSDNLNINDNFTLIIYGSNGDINNSIKINLFINVFEPSKLLNVNHFPQELSLVSGGNIQLNSNYILTSHSILSDSFIYYKIIQNPQNGVRFILKEKEELLNNSFSSLLNFTQEDINKGFIWLEHTPINEKQSWDVIGLQITTFIDDQKILDSEYYFVLIIRIEPLALQLRNFTEISYIQGKNYVLLNKFNLGAESNGDRSKIFYNITKAPENGTFYWVNGEKELNGFTQINIDNNEVLYSQMNMNAYQDSFEFILSNDEIELLPKKANIRVLPIFKPPTFVTNSRTILQLGLSHLNASELEGSSPRYLILPNGMPKDGRFFVHPNSNESTLFFTHDDIVNGRLYFHAFDVKYRTINNVILELKSDRVQPALINWPIIIRPSNNKIDELKTEINEKEKYKSQLKQQNQKTFLDNQIIPPPPPDMNYHFPVAILIAVVLLVVGILLCRKKTPQEEITSSEDGGENTRYNQQQKSNNNSFNYKNSIEKRNGNSTTKQHKKSVPENGINQKLNSSQPRMSVPLSSCLTNFENSENDIKPKNLLETTVYAAINNKQNNKDPFVSRNNNFAQNNESTFYSDDGGVYIGDNENKIKKLLELPLLITPSSSYTSATIPLLISSNNSSDITYLHNRTLNEKKRRDSTRPSILAMRNNSKEKQQLLATAVSAAFASKNVDEKRKEFLIPKEENEQLKIEPKDEENEKTKNNEKGKSTEFWV